MDSPSLNSQFVFALIISLTAIERVIELYIAKRNARWSFARDGKEFGQAHYPFMVFLHTIFLVACVAEVYFLRRGFTPVSGYTFIVLAALLQGLRWWCISTLGYRWNTRVIIVPGLPRISKGPYRWLSHPNYVAVVAEGIVLPLIHNAWITAMVFTILNAILLKFRIGVESNALIEMEKISPQR